MKNDFRGFYESLSMSLEGEEDNVYWEIIKYTPSFFKLLCKVQADKRISWHVKLIVNSALSYFVIPNDIIPEEEYGAKGYIDDVFVCAYVLKGIKDETGGKNIIFDNWEGEGEIDEIIDVVYRESRKVVGDKYKKILNFVGLLNEGKGPEEE